MKTELEEKDIEIIKIGTENKEKQKDMEDVKKTKECEEKENFEENNNSKNQKLKEMNIDRYEEVSLDKSIWAPKKEKCENKENIQAKVAAINVLGDNTKHREKCLRWTLR